MSFLTQGANTVRLALTSGSWWSRNAGTIAKIALPIAGGVIGGLALDQWLRPTSAYNSGGAPIYITQPPQTASDPFASIMNMMPMMMMMMMMVPMMQGLQKKSVDN